METPQIDNVRQLRPPTLTASELAQMEDPSPAQAIEQAEAEVAADIDALVPGFKPDRLSPQIWRRLVGTRAKYLRLVARERHVAAELTLRDYQHVLDAVADTLYLAADTLADSRKPAKGSKPAKH